MVQNGPAMICVKSKTRIPSSAAGMDLLSFLLTTLAFGLSHDPLLYSLKEIHSLLYHYEHLLPRTPRSVAKTRDLVRLIQDARRMAFAGPDFGMLL
jgi:hypothetical protein